jgi:plasmid stabilization system protein ParE
VRRRRRSKRFILAAAARADLREISAYIHQDSPAAAQRVRDALREAMRRLAEIPRMGHMREDLVEGDSRLRFWPVYSSLIVYRTETDPLEIVSVLHSARDVRAILGDA